jgi:hypothetical protein
MVHSHSSGSLVGASPLRVDISDGTSWVNLYFRDTTSSGFAPGSSKYGDIQAGPADTVVADLKAFFPSSDGTTMFTLTAQVGNAVDGRFPSYGYLDNLSFDSPNTPRDADFDILPVTEQLSVSFVDMSTGGITSWAWEFGDGQVSSSPSPTHPYASGGMYTVTLTVSGPSGSDSISKPVDLNSVPSCDAGGGRDLGDGLHPFRELPLLELPPDHDVDLRGALPGRRRHGLHRAGRCRPSLGLRRPERRRQARHRWQRGPELPDSD